MKTEKSATKVWVLLYYAGQFTILIATLIIFTKLTWQSQPVFASASATAWLVSSFLFYMSPHIADTNRKSYIRFLLIGIAEIILAILFWTVIKPRTEVATWGSITNMMLGLPSFLIAYVAVVSHFFPSLLQKVSTPPPNPLAEYPQKTQEIIKKGRYWVNVPLGVTIFIFFMVAAIGNTIIAIKFHDKSSNFFLIVILVGFIVSFTASIIATIKWQKWARASGIPEEELKAAAKAVHLWWPKIKEE